VDERDDGLSDQAVTILGLIAEGRSYDQILQRHPTLTYFDIFAAAREALGLRQATSTTPQRLDTPARLEPDEPTVRAFPEPDDHPPERVPAEPAPATARPSFIDRARATHSRAWARWTRDEDARLTALFRQGASREVIGEALGRQRGAIERRLLKLGLIAGADGEDAIDATPARTLPVLESSLLEPPASDVRPSPPAPRRRRSQSAPPTSIVPGWEAFRDRLSPDQDEA
jgi:hypothetical protein